MRFKITPEQHQLFWITTGILGGFSIIMGAMFGSGGPDNTEGFSWIVFTQIVAVIMMPFWIGCLGYILTKPEATDE